MASLTAEERKLIRERHHVQPCSCGGRRWVNDENWQPDRHIDDVRIAGDGLMPCGFCNEAGWDTPENEPAVPLCDFDLQLWPCDASRLLEEIDEAWAAIEASRTGVPV